ncbi:VOC family protein [Pseudaquabacterium pictum]|uniref:VOC family protein n=1 Tax=Pseudaquabacterium pictum TaxID=2315236 RepID=UPI0035712A04
MARKRSANSSIPAWPHRSTNVLVDDFEAALHFYRDRLDFDVLDDANSCDSRYVVLRPKGPAQMSICLSPGLPSLAHDREHHGCYAPMLFIHAANPAHYRSELELRGVLNQRSGTSSESDEGSFQISDPSGNNWWVIPFLPPKCDA